MSVKQIKVDEFNISDVEYKVCPCCGGWFSIPRIAEQPVCNRCYRLTVRELFKKENGELKISDFKEKVKELVNNESKT